MMVEARNWTPKTSCEGIKKAQAALINHSLTQQQLATQLGISRQPVSKFFQGKLVERYIFLNITEKLNLEWDEIVAARDVENAAGASQFDTLVEKVREKIKHPKKAIIPAMLAQKQYANLARFRHQLQG